LIARGRDAADVAIATTFGPSELETSRVWTDELIGSSPTWIAQSASTLP
jgi:hypothetical protein